MAFGRYGSAALHVITVGGLGTLTLNVMAQSWLLKSRRIAEGSPLIVPATALLAAATALRVYASFAGQPWLLVAAGCWAAAFALLLWLFFGRTAHATD